MEVNNNSDEIGNASEGVGAVPKHVPFSNLHAYLQYFGYLPAISIPTDNSFTNNSFTNNSSTSAAIKRFQRLSNIPQTGLLDIPTKIAMLRPRCAFPDADPIGAIATGGWSFRQIRYAFGNLSSRTPAPDCVSPIRAAFATWASAGAGLTFTEVSDGTEHIRIEWRPANDSDRDMRGSQVAHGDLPRPYSLIVQSLPLPLHFDDEESEWTVGSQVNKFDIQTIALHEIGHCLGLLHSENAASVMSPFVQSNHELRQLTPDDISSLKMLYP